MPLNLKVEPFDFPRLKSLLRGRTLILASGSPRRRQLLSDGGASFQGMASDVEELFLPHELPVEGCRRLALAKVRNVIQKSTGYGSRVVLGADTIVVLDGDILGKPDNPAHALALLERLDGRTHRVITAVALATASDWNAEQEALGHACADVTFGVHSRDQLLSYIATGDPFDKAGAYGAQTDGGFLVDSIVGRLDTVIGLPRDVVDSLSVELSSRERGGW